MAHAASRGPVPVRDAERRRTNDSGHVALPLESMAAMGIDTNPIAPDPERLKPADVDMDDPGDRRTVADHNGWHPYATELYQRLQRDPSAKWNGAGAQALDLIMCENLSRMLLPRLAGMIPGTSTTAGEPIYDYVPLNGSEMAAFLKWAAARGLYEGDRLRIGKEIEFFKDAKNVETASKATVTDITQRREDIFAAEQSG